MSFLYIDRDECIGDSLGKINDNAYNFDQRLITTATSLSVLTTTVETVSAGTVTFWDRKNVGLPGGTAPITGSWLTRQLTNYSEYPPSLSATLNTTTNTFILPAGTWLIRASSPAYKVRRFQIRLFNNTTNAPIANGTSEYSDNTKDFAQVRSYIETIYTTNGLNELSIQYQISNANTAVNALGVPAAFSEEIYTTVSCSKVG